MHGTKWWSNTCPSSPSRLGQASVAVHHALENAPAQVDAVAQKLVDSGVVHSVQEQAQATGKQIKAAAAEAGRRRFHQLAQPKPKKKRGWLIVRRYRRRCCCRCCRLEGFQAGGGSVEDAFPGDAHARSGSGHHGQRGQGTTADAAEKASAAAVPSLPPARTRHRIAARPRKRQLTQQTRPKDAFQNDAGTPLPRWPPTPRLPSRTSRPACTRTLRARTPMPKVHRANTDTVHGRGPHVEQLKGSRPWPGSLQCLPAC